MGYDADGNTYYLFDDNRLYYRDAPVIPEDKPIRKKFRGRKRKRGARRIESEEPESPPPTNGVGFDEDATWHVQCIAMDDWTSFLAHLKKSRDLDEKAMYRHLNDNVLPTLIEEEKERERQRELKEQEYLREQAFLARKRSTRLVQKEEDRKHQETREMELAKIQAAEEERKKEEQRIKKLEQEREARLQLREQRQRERELRIQQREEERKRAIEEAERTGKPIKFIVKQSESPAPIKKTSRQQALESQRGTSEPESRPKSEETWFFDCLCGKHGTNYVHFPVNFDSLQDDGTLAVACEKCDIWQHVACLPDSKDREELTLRNGAPEGTYPDYEFVCGRCKKKAKEASKADAVKSKDQIRKEREREANKAKYERRKLREKAKKEEERRKREEEQRTGIINNGQGFGASTGEIRVAGAASSPIQGTGSSDPRTSASDGLLYGVSRFSPSSTTTSPYLQHGTPTPGQYPSTHHPGAPSQYNPSHNIPMQNAPNHYSSSPPQSVQQRPIQVQGNYPQQTPYNQSMAQHVHPRPQQFYQHPPPQFYSYPPPQQQSSQTLPPHQQPAPQKLQSPQLQQAPQHPAQQPLQHPPQPQYQPLRPAIQPYWSPFTTSSSLPNGQQFPTSNRPPQSNSNTPQTQQRSIKPAPSNQSRPLQIAAYPGSQMARLQPNVQPNIQPKESSKSPELERVKDVLGTYPPAPEGLPTPMNSFSTGSQVEANETVPKLPPPLPQSEKPVLGHAVQGNQPANGQPRKPQEQKENQIESTKVASPVRHSNEDAPTVRVGNIQVMNGEQTDVVDPDEALKETERTKMAFLLN